MAEEMWTLYLPPAAGRVVEVVLGPVVCGSRSGAAAQPQCGQQGAAWFGTAGTWAHGLPAAAHPAAAECRARAAVSWMGGGGAQ